MGLGDDSNLNQREELSTKKYANRTLGIIGMSFILLGFLYLFEYIYSNYL
jgi:hypothetical protein